MGEAIDQMRNDVFAEESPYEFGSRLSSAQIRRAIDEYDAAAATAGRLMAENAELRSLAEALQCEVETMRSVLRRSLDDRNEYRTRMLAAEDALRFAYATKTDVPSETESVCSVPGNAWDVIVRDRDEWKRRAETAEAEALALRLKVARLESPRATEAEARAQQARSLAGETHKPHPEDEVDCAEGVRQAKAGEGISGDAAWEYLDGLFIAHAKDAASKIQPMPESLKAEEAKHADEPDVSGRDDDSFSSRWRLP